MPRTAGNRFGQLLAVVVQRPRLVAMDQVGKRIDRILVNQDFDLDHIVREAQEAGRCSKSSRSLWRPAACFNLRSQRREMTNGTPARARS